MKSISLIVFIIVLMLSCANCFAQSYEIRTNGVFQSQKEDGYWHYIKFINDTSVISVTSSGRPQKIKKWFNINHNAVSIGEYKLEGDSISFFTTSDDGTVIYNGKMSKKRLQLHSESQINGYISDEKYKFKKF